MSTIIQKSKENEFKELSPKIKLDYEHNSKVVKNLLSKEELTKRYKIFCRAFDLNVGDIIYIYMDGTFTILERIVFIYMIVVVENKVIVSIHHMNTSLTEDFSKQRL